MTIKEFFSKVKDIAFKFFTFIGLIFSGAVALILLFKNIKKTPVEKIDVKEVENEIKKTDSKDIIADSPNQSDISSSIEQQQQQFRERVRNRFNKDLHRE